MFVSLDVPKLQQNHNIYTGKLTWRSHQFGAIAPILSMKNFYHKSIQNIPRNLILNHLSKTHPTGSEGDDCPDQQIV
jgi:hypothetical protein